MTWKVAKNEKIKYIIRTALFSSTLLFTVLTSSAQNIDGIKFQTGLSFDQIKKKAKTENKYIFVDTYTTWCIPCKKMEEEIFPLKRAGDFFNSNFINYKVQIDRKQNDPDFIKKAYNDASFIEKTYSISSYPTYLVLNADGILLHQVIGASESVEEFINKMQKALDPVTQGSNLVKEFDNGRRDSSFLKLMIEYGSKSDTKNRASYVQAYLKTQENLLTAQNIRYILQSVASSRDVGYDILINHPKEVIAAANERWRNYVIDEVIFNDHILPLLRKEGKKEILAGGMYAYKGEIINNVNWILIKELLEEKFKDRSDVLLINAKINYYRWSNDWKNINIALLNYVNENNSLDLSLINTTAQYFISFCKESENLNYAIKWAEVLKKSNQKNFTDTYNELAKTIHKVHNK
ncbi:thioredoxin family protein [Pedobacter ureilyticus]|uniref:Thioredoxin family protein n=1 Tax=Pedobacter ureilyticus TaxID=1393051 RepID=A0ABW9JAK9_9SPHI|nr:thioredoxin family protein [Pedobacter helvus]